MNSIIISPYTKGVSGTAERTSTESSTSIRFDINHPQYETGDMLRLYVMSTSHAAHSPYLIGYYEAKGSADTLSGNFTDDNLKDKTFSRSDADTYLITHYDGKNEEPVAAAFFGLEWNAARFLTATADDGEDKQNADGRIHSEHGNSNCDAAIANAKKVLGGLKNGKKISKAKIDEYISGVKKTLSAYEPLEGELAADGYEWHKITGKSRITNLSAVSHILSGKYAMSAVNRAGYYIAGIKNDDPCHIAIGIPECRHVCPMPQLRDCCVFSGGYHIAGVYLADDGQYFEKYLQNE